MLSGEQSTFFHFIKVLTLSIAVEYGCFGFLGSSFVAFSHSKSSPSVPKSRSSSFSNAWSLQVTNAVPTLEIYEPPIFLHVVLRASRISRHFYIMYTMYRIASQLNPYLWMSSINNKNWAENKENLLKSTELCTVKESRQSTECSIQQQSMQTFTYKISENI